MHLDRGRFSKLLRRDVLLTTSSHIKAVMFCNFNVDFPALLCGQSPRTPRYELPWHRGAVSSSPLPGCREVIKDGGAASVTQSRLNFSWKLSPWDPQLPGTW